MGVTNDDTGTATRRAMLAGAGAAGVAVTLAACGTDSGNGGSTPIGGAPATTGAAPATNQAAPPTSAAPPADSGIKTSDIPVKGGKIFQDTNTVVTQPAKGTFKAFSATCTHQGCTVGSVADNVIHCPCHKSAFNATDGSVKNGPAAKPLPAKKVTVNGDTITVS
jgi:Rieske Fe-S protein